MPRPVNENSKVVETWEITTNGTVWVYIYDRRNDTYTKQRVGGRGGSRKLHINRDDRIFNQEQVVDENRQHDVFTNGLLRFVSANDGSEPDLELKWAFTEDQMKELFTVKDLGLFEEEVRQIQSELALRRLTELAEKEATNAQYALLRDLVEERYKVGGTQRAVADMIRSGEQLAGMTLS